SIGIIDTDSMRISLCDVKDPLSIKSVEYMCSDDVQITPAPESKVGDWQLKEIFRLQAGSNFEDYTVEFPDHEANVVEIKFFQFDATLISGETSIGVIDDDNMLISLYGVKHPSEIVSVEYTYSEGGRVNPTPESRIGDWGVTEQFSVAILFDYVTYTVVFPDYVAPVYTNQATIAPLDTFGCVTKYHMLDLNASPTKAATDALASAAFGEQGLNGIRVPIYCGDYYGAHPEEGVVTEINDYTNVLKSINNAKKYYKGTEPFVVFAGIKVMTSNKDEYFPDWVTTDSETVPNPDKYAQLIVDFITFMHSKGHDVHAIALTKEAAKLTVDDFKETVDSIRARTARLGYVLPKIVAPELFKADGNVPDGFMNQLYSKGYQDSYDVYGNHYYHWQYDVSGYNNLAYEFNLAQSDKKHPFWATEPHWDQDKNVLGAEMAIAPMFLQTDLGLEAFMWWGAHYPITGTSNMSAPIIRGYSSAILGSTPIRMIDHDGEEVITRGKLHSRAYLRGNEVNVFFINSGRGTPVSYEDYVIGILDDFDVNGEVTFRQWTADTGNAGEYTMLNPVASNQIIVDLPTGSFTQLTFNIGILTSVYSH
ncbi:hypothetical protein OAA06_02415, partial [bacterium]|nr:hypothetical protein [bacterium]